MLNFYQNILKDLPLSTESFSVIILASAIMFWFFWEDFSSYKNGKHKDFKSILVSTGVLGTFVGIFIGLLGFDSNEVSKSVPTLLDGLKTAFITSIIGMSLAVFLSVFQKRKEGDNAEDEIIALNNIDKKLINLNDIKKHTESLPFINTNIKSLSSDISSVKKVLETNHQSLGELLKRKLSEIDQSLKEAVQALAKGATEEIIEALQNVIKDFNNNLTEQFGDNFKQLNESVLKMIEWQETYKDSVREFEEQLSLMFEQMEIAVSTTADNAKQINEITENYTKIAVISENLEEVITTNQHQIQNLTSHLKTLAEISNNAKGMTENLKSFSNQVQGALSNQAQALTKLTEEVESQLPKSLDVLNKSLTTLTVQFASDYENFLEKISKLMQVNNIN